MRRYAVTTGLVALGLGSGVALAACGGDSTPETPIVVSDTTSSADLSKAEFISQADDICNTANTQIADIAAAGEGITRAADVADIRQGVVTDIQALGTPIDDSSSSSSIPTTSSTDSSADTSALSGVSGSDTSATSTGTSTGSTATGNDLQDFLTAISAEVTAGQKIDLASQRGESTAQAESELSSAKDDAATAASSYGFLECGTDGTASSAGTDTTSSSSSSSGTSVAPSTSAPSTSAPSTSGGSSGSSGTSTGSSGGTSGSGGGVGPG
jgi:hypothetical protein